MHRCLASAIQLALAGSLLAPVAVVQAQAAQVQVESAVDFSIGLQPLSTALVAFGQQTRLAGAHRRRKARRAAHSRR